MAQTILRNAARCNIILPFVGEELEGLVSPGDEITVGPATMETDFVKNLIEIGELIDLGDVHEYDAGELSLEELRAKCDELGIERSDRWSRAKLQLEIAKVAPVA
jgi:hypothetical protein